MNTAVVIALIALAGSILSTVVTVFGAPIFQARREARGVLETYRGPLLDAAYELQARLHNILATRFIESYLLDSRAGKQEAARERTLYVFAQFFAREIIRREVQFLRLASDAQTREISAAAARW